MKKNVVLPLAVAIFATAYAGAAQARMHRYGGGCAYVYRDYSLGNAKSPTTYIYPSANWGPLFHCFRFFGPILNAAAN